MRTRKPVTPSSGDSGLVTAPLFPAAHAALREVRARVGRDARAVDRWPAVTAKRRERHPDDAPKLGAMALVKAAPSDGARVAVRDSVGLVVRVGRITWPGRAGGQRCRAGACDEREEHKEHALHAASRSGTVVTKSLSETYELANVS